MAHFEKRVNTRSRKAMVEFLTGHFRYDTMNSCNDSTSYAHNMKIHNLPLSKEEKDRLYDLFDCEGVYDDINELMRDFDREHRYGWQVGFNGRNGGYLVLYQGGLRDGQPYCTPGKSTDQGEDFVEWTMYDLRERVRLVCEFDRLADCVVEQARYLANTYEAVDAEVMVPKKVRVLVGREVA